MSKFEIRKDIPVPTGRAARESKYPFDDMEVGDCIIIEPTEDSPEPWKTKASTVNSWNRANAVETGETKVTPSGKERKVYEYEKKLTITKGDLDGETVAFIHRVK